MCYNIQRRQENMFSLYNPKLSHIKSENRIITDNEKILNNSYENLSWFIQLCKHKKMKIQKAGILLWYYKPQPPYIYQQRMPTL